MANISSQTNVDLTNCDREPIQVPGSIQTHGCLLVTDVSVTKVLRHSRNAPAMLEVESDLNGRSLERLIGDRATHDLRNALSTSNDAARPALLINMSVNNLTFDVAIHSYKSSVIIEFERAARVAGQPLDLSRSLIDRIKNAASTGQLSRDSARLISGVLGYDRVMIYRFEHDGAGQVVSETKRSDLESFMGQYFPASDIPKQARELYLRNTIRIISSAAGDCVPIEPVKDASGELLDLSYAHLRSVSPIHLEYLRNMGVAASMSISIIVGGELWGLIACHHYSPKTLSMAERVAAEMFGEFFSLNLEALHQKRKLEAASEARKSLDRVLQLASYQPNLGEVLQENLTDLLELMPCDGIGLWIDGLWTTRGAVPPIAAMPALTKLVGEVADGKIWATHALSQKLLGADSYSSDVSGVLAIPLSQRPRDYLLFFRKEVTQTLNWAGNPEKSYETGPLGDRLTPRKSFAIWKESVQMQATPWTDSDREIAEAARAALVEIVLRHNEMMADERGKADVRQRMLNEELNHRVKNILAVIKSLVGHPVNEGQDLVEYVASLKGRVQALALAHDQIARGVGGGFLRDLLGAELSPYRDRDSRIILAGPDVWLDDRAFSVMALVLHELSTNAAKYGSLSSADGVLNVDWAMLADRACRLSWVESGGPKVRKPSREGFGTVLIGRSVPYDLGGESRIEYAEAGVRATFVVPAKHASITEARVSKRVGTKPVQVKLEDNVLEGSKLLLVEDQMLIALDLQEMLSAKGARDIIAVNSSADALKNLRTFSPDAAILDINLGSETSLSVAVELYRRKVPFIFATGYGDKSSIPAEFSAIPVIRKPYEAEQLIMALLIALRRVEDG